MTEFKLRGGIYPGLERVPPEIWSDIFRLAHLKGVDFYEMRQTPWPHSQVCRQWRAAAHACPALWSNIVMPTGSARALRGKFDVNLLLHRTALCLQNSRQHALRIRVAESSLPDDDLEALFKLLWPHRARWSVFAMDVATDWSIDMAIGVSEYTPLPLLRELTLSLPLDSGLSFPILKLFRGAPDALTSLNFDHPPPWATGPNAEFEEALEWTNIRNIRLQQVNCPDSTSFSALMDRVHNVTVLHLHLDNSPQLETTSALYLFPHLVVLFWQNVDHRNGLLPMIIAPRLEALHLGQDFDPELLIAFISRSKCNIQHLYMGYVEEEAFPTVLNHTPSLLVFAALADDPGIFTDILFKLQGGFSCDGPNQETEDPGPKFQHLRAVDLWLYDNGYNDSAMRYELSMYCIADFLDTRWPAPANSHSNSVPAADARCDRSPRLQLRFGVPEVSAAPDSEETTQTFIGTSQTFIERIQNHKSKRGVDVDVGCLSRSPSSEDRCKSLLGRSPWTELNPGFPANSPGGIISNMVRRQQLIDFGHEWYDDADD